MRKRRKGEQPSGAAQAFINRVQANLHVPSIADEVCQYWNEHPQRIPHGLYAGFNTYLASQGVAGVLPELENFIWYADAVSSVRARQFLIWFLRQSKELTESIVLRSFPEYVERRDNDVFSVSYECGHLIGHLQSSGSRIRLAPYMVGLGVCNYLTGGTGGHSGWLYFTEEILDTTGARTITWEDATAGYSKVEVPDWVHGRTNILSAVPEWAYGRRKRSESVPA
jgi:hypothetical protein